MVTPKQNDPQFKLRLPGPLKERIESAALKNNRSINAEIVDALESAFPSSITIDWVWDRYLLKAQESESNDEAEKIVVEGNRILERHGSNLFMHIAYVDGSRLVSIGNAPGEMRASMMALPHHGKPIKPAKKRP